MHVVDSQWHWHPPALLDHHLGRDAYPRSRRTPEGYLYEISADEVWTFDRRFTDLDHQVRVLDTVGIDTAVVSASVTGDLADRDLGEARELCALLNEEMARAQKAHPGRFLGLAHLPLSDTDASLATLDDAVRRLALRGVLLPGNIAGESVAAPRLWPLYAEIERLGLPVFLHPTRSFREPRVTPSRMEVPIGYMFDTSFATMALIVDGVLDRFPRLTIVHPHAGGTLPYLHGRIEVYRGKGWWPHLDRPFVDYLRRLYFDTVCNQPETLALLMRVVGPERLLFSSDYPYWSARKAVDLVRAQAPAEHLPGILGGHAQALLA
ncbi:amidohydrolase family protein [Pseudonocardia acaciae]|uniref:amidohydrolase family protein n=1 Tax=Pseudonocardia acaciae TaxID=551276 RepID=UPI0004909164|nr:amidohydrolase family protein [Pseudonocardia acaciae]